MLRQAESLSQINWRRRRDLNPRIKVLQTFALPLGYAAIVLRLRRLLPRKTKKPLGPERLRW